MIEKVVLQSFKQSKNKAISIQTLGKALEASYKHFHLLL